MKIIYLLVFTLLFIACGSAGKEKAGQGTRFFYYPVANVYLDIDNETYFQLDPVQGWKPQELTEEQISGLGNKVLLDDPQLPVWKNNEAHKMIYAADLYAPQDYQKKLEEDSLKSVPKKDDSVVVEKDNSAPKKEKKGIGKFFDKIFGKKKKD